MTPGKASAVGALLIALGPISLALYTPAMPQLVTDFATEPATIKLTLGVYFLGFALAQLAAGPLSDAWGRRPVVLGFMVVYVAGSTMAVFAPTVDWLLAARAVQGIGAAAGVAIARAIVRDLFTGQESVRVMNTIGLMLGLGPAMAPTVGGITMDLLGWHAIFLLMVLYGLVVAAAVLFLVPETLARRDPEAIRLSRLAASYRTLVLDLRFVRPTLVLALTIGTFYSFAVILPFVLVERVGLTPSQFGIGMLAQSGSFMLGSAVVRQLLHRFDGPLMVPFGLALAALGAVLLPALNLALGPSYLSVMVPAGVIAFALPFSMASMMTDLMAPFPRIAGAAAALSGFAQMAAGLCGTLVAAAIGDTELALVTVVPAMIAAAIAIQLALRGPTARRERAAAEAERAPAE